MSTILIASIGYGNRKSLWPTTPNDPFTMAQWEHCTAGFDNPNQIPDSRLQRAHLTAMFTMHNIRVEFTSPLKGKK